MLYQQTAGPAATAYVLNEVFADLALEPAAMLVPSPATAHYSDAASSISMSMAVRSNVLPLVTAWVEARALAA